MSKFRFRRKYRPIPIVKDIQFGEVILSHRKGIQQIEELQKVLSDLESQRRLKSKHDVVDICLCLGEQGKTEALTNLHRLIAEKSVFFDMRLEELRKELKKIIRRHRYDFRPNYLGERLKEATTSHLDRRR